MSVLLKHIEFNNYYLKTVSSYIINYNDNCDLSRFYQVNTRPTDINKDKIRILDEIRNSTSGPRICS